MKRARLLSLLLLGGLAVIILGCRMSQPPSLGAANGRLFPCPASPNCVCSQDADPDHQIAPLPFKGSGSDALTLLRTIIEREPRTRILVARPDYLRAEFRSLIFRFVDDVELLLDEPNQVIHVRSASRVGHSDLGVNRKRVERLRVAFAE